MGVKTRGTYLFSIVVNIIPCNIHTMTFTHNYLMPEFPSERKNLNVNISNDICTIHYV